MKRYGKTVPWPSLWPYYPELPVFQLLRNTAARLPDRPVILHPQRITYSELDDLSDRVASALSKLGIGRGNTVALFMWNSPEFIIAFFGALKTGATITALDPLLKEKDASYQLEDSESTTVVVDDSQYPIVNAIWDRLPRLGNVIVVGKERPSGTYLFQEVVRTDPCPPRVTINPKEEIAVLQYTSGTTGLPKGCMLTHHNLTSNVIQNRLISHAFNGSLDDISMSHLPFCHIYGLTVLILVPISAGTSQVIMRRFEPQEFLELIHKFRITTVRTVMPVISSLVDYPDLTKYDLSSVRYISSGAVALVIPIAKKFEALTGITLTHGYGLSEASPVTNINPLMQIKLESVGPPLPDTEEKIVDVETGTRELACGEVGELIVKGPQVMKGYWRKPRETAKTIRNGWLYTGDLAKMDEDGYLYIIDRKKEIIKYMGFTIGPGELEETLRAHPTVADCIVVGKPDSVAMEIPKGFVLLKKGAKATEAELIIFVQERLAEYKKIREIEFVKTIPRSASGKVLRRGLIQRERELASYLNSARVQS